VKQRSTPEAVLRKLKKGKYRDWAEEGDETRCPICLENVCHLILHCGYSD